MSSRALRALVVEDNAFTRMTLCGTLVSAGVDVVGEAGTARDALAGARASSADVALIDLDLGDGPTGVDVAGALRRDAPSVGIVILTSFADPRAAGVDPATLPRGAVYLTKGELGDVEALVISLARAVRLAVAAGDHPAVATRSSVLARLTDNQVEMLRMVATGLSNAEIARERGISTSAVERTLARIAEQVGVPNDASTNRRVLLARAYMHATGGA